MKITFKDQSFIEIIKSNDKFIVSIQARDVLDPLKKITNSSLEDDSNKRQGYAKVLLLF